MNTFTLCWDCAKSIHDGCSWAEKLVPVKGWNATVSEKKEFTSYQVNSCPEFERDSWGFGMYRTEKEFLERRKENEDE